ILLSMLLMFGCGESKIDTSTDEAMRSSIEKVRESLPADMRKHFNEAMLTVAIGDNSNIEPSDINERMKAKLNGKTGLEIIAEAGYNKY
ncbi:hypothetical protein QUF70_09250, partial [Desulfobacterales bacterium HSG17]|nr:hypothetical protein [Desulfobacterales bacterium HSG17]